MYVFGSLRASSTLELALGVLRGYSYGMSDTVLDIAKLRLEALENEANELRSFIRMYIRLGGSNTMPAPRHRGAGLPSAMPTRQRSNFAGHNAPQSDDPSPKEAIIDVVRAVLKQVHPRPLLIGDLFEAVIARGVNIGGQNPKGNLSAKLAPIDDIIYIKDEGWYYRPKEKEAPDVKPSKVRSEASWIDQLAKDREAGSGGGP